MPVSGLVLTLSLNAPDRAAALDALRRHPSIEVGEAQGHRLPIVVDTPASDDDRAVWDWLHAQEGILFVDVVCADASADEHTTQERSAP